ncbi:MAG: hypothetical protein A2297_08710 [Elusimicrobia bacterium RIFOXYB2_FULL_48_7]|nr:MAG: hypothetical protein A2297_08710 [Elusimicrobia bacterium RIFOXYB2_FULL_48_7]
MKKFLFCGAFLALTSFSFAQDSTPPSAPAQVRDGTGGTDIDSTGSRTTLSANWDPAVDAESGIKKYWYAIGKTPGGTDISAMADNGNSTSVTKTGLTLAIGATYYFSVRAVNGLGLVSTASNSNGQCVEGYIPPSDTTPPTAPPQVRDGTGADVAYSNSSTELYANWDPSSDSESGIRQYYYGVGTSPGGADVTGWRWTGSRDTAIHITFTKKLAIGTIYYVSIKADNWKGLSGPVTSSNGQRVNRQTFILSGQFCDVYQPDESVTLTASGPVTATAISYCYGCHTGSPYNFKFWSLPAGEYTLSISRNDCVQVSTTVLVLDDTTLYRCLSVRGGTPAGSPASGGLPASGFQREANPVRPASMHFGGTGAVKKKLNELVEKINSGK